tara:strand:- start:1099 stop:1299 length:201 start_codon:yes stop_codon:yes gene_type:complete
MAVVSTIVMQARNNPIAIPSNASTDKNIIIINSALDRSDMVRNVAFFGSGHVCLVFGFGLYPGPDG